RHSEHLPSLRPPCSSRAKTSRGVSGTRQATVPALSIPVRRSAPAVWLSATPVSTAHSPFSRASRNYQARPILELSSASSALHSSPARECVLGAVCGLRGCCAMPCARRGLLLRTMTSAIIERYSLWGITQLTGMPHGLTQFADDFTSYPSRKFKNVVCLSRSILISSRKMKSNSFLYVL